ncbi:hypothetical protein [Lactococcus petauri]|uniref:hypothetical protein n=1 Tax=Lactococcus petauri TaxID=1940789 RepID=UPI001FB02122|nr:hypothetical protein [Lactococcus petauri]
MKIIEQESKGIYNFEGEYSEGIYYTAGKSRIKFCICSSESTIDYDLICGRRSISIAQFLLDIDLFYRIQKVLPQKTISSVDKTHQAMLKFLEVNPLFKDQFNQKIKTMIDNGERLVTLFYEDTEVTYQ